MLTKYLANKPTMLWDLYLPQALFACRVRVHATTKRSPFFLLYGVHPRLPSDENPPRPLEIEITTEDHEKRIAQLHHARIEANELLLKRAIYAQKVRSDLVKPEHSGFKPGQWVLVRQEGPEKFQAKWYGPYYVVNSHPLGTYKIRDPQGNILRHLINGQRLFHANGGNIDPVQLWSSPTMQAQLKRQNIDWAKPSKEVQMILDSDAPLPPTYEDLASLTQKEWKELERTGVCKILVGEENIPLPNNSQTLPQKTRRPRRKATDFSSAPADLSERSNALTQAPGYNITRADTRTTTTNQLREVPNQLPIAINPISHQVSSAPGPEQVFVTSNIHDVNPNLPSPHTTSRDTAHSLEVSADIEKDEIYTPQMPTQGKRDGRDVREGVRARGKRKNIHTRKSARNQGPSMMSGGDIEETPAILSPVQDHSEGVAGLLSEDASGISSTPYSTIRKPTGPLVGQELNHAANDTRSKRGSMPSSGNNVRVRPTSHYGLRKRPTPKQQL
jgi:hypothetical protein